MDLSNLRKSKKDKDSPAARLNQSDNSNQDAAPGQKSPKNIMETNTWKKASPESPPSGKTIWTSWANTFATTDDRSRSV